MTAGSGETINVDTVVGTVLIQAGYAELADAPPLASAHQFAALAA